MLQQRKKNTHVVVSISTTLVAESRGNSHTTRTMHRKVVPDTNSWHWIFAYCLQIISSPIVPIVGKTLFVRLSRNYISFFFSLFLSLCLGSICSIMFVQAPALMVQQRSENSEEDSEEEGTGDVLQVDRSFAF